MASKKKMTVKAEIEKSLTAGLDKLEGIDTSNVGAFLLAIFYWQEVMAFAEAKLKAAYSQAANEGVFPADDKLRQLGKGEHIVAESDRFSLLASVQDPRLIFDREACFASICRKFGIDRNKLNIVVDQSKRQTTPPLGKYVVEAT